MKYAGDYVPTSVIRVLFNTRAATGAPITLAGTPAVSVYKDGNTTQSTTGVTLTVDFDSVTGMHLITVDTSTDGAFYSAGSDFHIVITAGTVDSVSVVGSVVASFSLNNRSALRPTVAGRTLDVSAGGEAGVDWANIGSPTTTVNLSATTIKTATDVETDTLDIQSRLPAALVGGRMDANVGAISGDSPAADNLETMLDGTGGSALTATFTGNLTGSVGSVSTNGITAASIAPGAIDADAISTDVVTELRSLVGGTADSGTTTTLVDSARAETDTDHWVGSWVLFTSGNLAGQVRLITAFDPALDTITFAPPVTQAVSTHSYEILPAAALQVGAYLSGQVPLQPTVAGRTLDVTATGAAGIDWSNVENATTSLNLSGTTFATSQSIASVSGSVGGVAPGGITANSITTGALTAAKFASGAIDAAALGSDAVNEIRDAVWTKAMSELSAIPGINSTVLEALQWCFTVSRNKITQTSTTQTVFKDDGVTSLAASTHSDDGTTHTRGKWV